MRFMTRIVAVKEDFLNCWSFPVYQPQSSITGCGSGVGVGVGVGHRRAVCSSLDWKGVVGEAEHPSHWKGWRENMETPYGLWDLREQETWPHPSDGQLEVRCQSLPRATSEGREGAQNHVLLG